MAQCTCDGRHNDTTDDRRGERGIIIIIFYVQYILDVVTVTHRQV